MVKFIGNHEKVFVLFIVFFACGCFMFLSNGKDLCKEFETIGQ